MIQVRNKFLSKKKYIPNLISNALVQLLRFLILYLFARISNPREFGIVSLILLVSSYAVNSNLGTVNGIKRQLPLKYLKKESDYQKEAVSTIFFFNLISSSVIISIVTVYMFNFYDTHRYLYSFLLILFSVVFNSYFFFQTVFLSKGDLPSLLKFQIIIVVLSIAFQIPIFLLKSGIIFMIANLLIYFIPVVYGYNQMEIKCVFKKDIILENIKVGFPIMVVGFLFLLFQSTDRLVATTWNSKEILGYYSFAWVIVSGFNLFQNFIVDIIQQKSTIFYSNNYDIKALFSFISKKIFQLNVVILMISVVIYFTIDKLILIYFPQYVASVVLIHNILIAFNIQQLSINVSVFYYIINKQSYYMLILIIINVLNIILMFFWRLNVSWAFISVIFIITSILYSTMMYLSVIKYFNSRKMPNTEMILSEVK